MRSSGQLVLGTTLQPGTSGLPHAGQVNSQNVGLDVDLRNAVAKVLGVTWNVQNGTFATIIPGVQNGKYQVGQDNFGATKAREQVVDFATYLNDGQAFLGASTVSASSISAITGACGYTIATAPGSTFQTLLTSNASKCAATGKKPWTVQYFSDSAPIFLGLANGKVDLYFGPTLSLKYDAAHIAGTKFLGQISSTPVGFVTAKNSPDRQGTVRRGQRAHRQRRLRQDLRQVGRRRRLDRQVRPQPGHHLLRGPACPHCTWP